MIDQGCDLICIDLSSSAVAQVCEERGVKFIGSSVDMREFAPTQPVSYTHLEEALKAHLYISMTRMKYAIEVEYKDYFEVVNGSES